MDTKQVFAPSRLIPASAALAIATLGILLTGPSANAQQPTTSTTPATDATPQKYLPIPAFDTSSMDTTVDPCTDFYKFSCGRFAANHPIPPDPSSSTQFSELQNVNTQALSGILEKEAADNTTRTPPE